MPIETLLNVPTDDHSWNIFSFAHRLEHDRICQVIFTKTNGQTNLFRYNLDPINFDDFTQWLENNQSMHDDMNEVLQLQGVDLEGVDIKDSNQLQSWIFLHWQEHQSACLALGI